MDVGELCSRLAVTGGAVPWNRIVYSRVSSTNAVGKLIATSFLDWRLEVAPTVVLALEQTGGRGRLGRRWTSSPGGIYVSLVTPAHWPCPLPVLPLRVATVLCAELDRVIGQDCRLKWPNDLIVQGRKLGGVLVESVRRGEGACAVIGFGINYSQELPRLVEGATSVLELSPGAQPLVEMVSRLTNCVATALDEVVSMAEAVEEYERWTLHQQGEQMCCRTTTDTCSGRFVGFDARGFLRLETADGERTFSVGDLIETTEAAKHVQP